MSNRIAPKLLAEFIGTFALIFIGAGAGAVVGAGVGLPGLIAIAFAHGLTVMAFAFAYGSVSGGHFNPSVTVGVLAAGAMSAGEAFGYIVSQLIGGVAGALLLKTVLGGAATGLGMPALAHNLALGATTLTVTPWAGFVIEAVLAFFLVTVVLSTAVASRAGPPRRRPNELRSRLRGRWRRSGASADRQQHGGRDANSVRQVWLVSQAFEPRRTQTRVDTFGSNRIADRARPVIEAKFPATS